MKQVKYISMVITTLFFSMLLVLGISQPVFAADMPPLPTDTPADILHQRWIEEQIQQPRQQIPLHLDHMRVQDLPESIYATGLESIWIEDTLFGIWSFEQGCEVDVAIPAIGFASTLQADVLGNASQSFKDYPALEPGMEATASGCGATKTLVIPDLGIDSVIL